MTTRIEGLFNFTKPLESAARGTGTSAVAVEATARPALLTAPLASTMPADNIHIHLEAPPATSAAANKPAARSAAPKHERRHRRRVKISAPVRIRQIGAGAATDYDYTMTTDVSREGLLFESANATYARGQEVGAVFPYRPAPGETVKEQRGIVVRVARASERRWGVAIAFVEGEPTHEIVDSSGRPIRAANDILVAGGNKKFVVIAETDAGLRASLRAELEREGYAVDAVATVPEALSVMRMRAPDAIICEAEPSQNPSSQGNEMSGYDLCVVTRRNAKLAGTPVILTTRTGLPSDFATAHALGATVCVAKPYELTRMSNVLRMLVPVESQ